LLPGGWLNLPGRASHPLKYATLPGRTTNSSTFGSLKTKLIHHCAFQGVTEAEQALFHSIEVYYNRQRKHSTNGYKSPAQYELEWWNSREAA